MDPFGGWQKEEPKEQSRGCQGCAELPEPALILPPSGGDGHKRHPCKNLPFASCKSGFLNLGAMDVLGRTILRGEGLPRALEAVQRHPWPLPPGCQWYPALGQPKISPDITRCDLGCRITPR